MSGRSGGRTAAPFSAKKREGYVDTMPTAALSGVVHHVRATSASLRKYNVPPTPSAISSISTTFARRPKAPYKQVSV